MVTTQADEAMGKGLPSIASRCMCPGKRISIFSSANGYLLSCVFLVSLVANPTDSPANAESYKRNEYLRTPIHTFRRLLITLGGFVG